MRASLRPFLVTALLGTAAAVPAWAQTNADGAGAGSYPKCTAKPSQADTDAAHGAYMAGKGSFDEADYTTAINYFRDAYRRDCTKHELLIIIARAYELQGKRQMAVDALQTYLDRVPNAQDAEVQRRHIANLQKEIAESQASAAPPPPSASAAPPPPPPTAAPVSSAPAAPSPEPAPTTEGGGHTIAPWIVVGVGGAALITGGVLLGVGSGQVSSAESQCGSNHVCPSGDTSAVNNGNSGRSLETVGIAVGAVGIAGVAGGLLWHFLEKPSAQAKSGSVTVTPSMAPGYAGLGVGGRF